MTAKEYNDWFDNHVSERLDFWINNTYPLTIICDRYNGAYSGGRFTAWPVDEWMVPRLHCGDDGQCMTFWNEIKAGIVGVGDTPDKALENLIENMTFLRDVM